ncbi:hypothetical protein BH09ACT1_BH09ACT1_05190 [soil metagenome]
MGGAPTMAGLIDGCAGRLAAMRRNSEEAPACWPGLLAFYSFAD